MASNPHSKIGNPKSKMRSRQLARFLRSSPPYSGLRTQYPACRGGADRSPVGSCRQTAQRENPNPRWLCHCAASFTGAVKLIVNESREAGRVKPVEVRRSEPLSQWERVKGDGISMQATQFV